MNPRRPPKKGPCPAGGDHVWENHGEGGGWVTHKCKNCPATYRRRLDPNRNAA